MPPSSPAAPDLMLHANRQWAYILGWGNYSRGSQIASGFGDTVRLRLVDGIPRSSGRIALAIHRPDPAAAPGCWELRWPSEGGALYRVDWSPDLAEWHTLANFLPAAGPTTSFTVDLEMLVGFVPPAAFFRIANQLE